MTLYTLHIRKNSERMHRRRRVDAVLIQGEPDVHRRVAGCQFHRCRHGIPVFVGNVETDVVFSLGQGGVIERSLLVFRHLDPIRCLGQTRNHTIQHFRLAVIDQYLVFDLKDTATLRNLGCHLVFAAAGLGPAQPGFGRQFADGKSQIGLDSDGDCRVAQHGKLIGRRIDCEFKSRITGRLFVFDTEMKRYLAISIGHEIHIQRLGKIMLHRLTNQNLFLIHKKRTRQRGRDVLNRHLPGNAALYLQFQRNLRVRVNIGRTRLGQHRRHREVRYYRTGPTTGHRNHCHYDNC